jgi:hypothetical protein
VETPPEKSKGSDLAIIHHYHAYLNLQKIQNEKNEPYSNYSEKNEVIRRGYGT